MEKEKTTAKIELLEETAESMKTSLENMKKVQNEQNILLDVISGSDKKEFFEEFIKETKNQISKMSDQIDRLTKRHECLLDVINNYKKNIHHAKLLEKFMSAIGLYE